jgi:predicted dehydrogenase
MTERRIGIISNGATGRMGTTQHVANLLAIAADGGLVLGNGDRLIPDPLLVGRDADRLGALSAVNGDLRWTTSLDEALSGPDMIFMDCSATGGRPARVLKAIAAGKHIHIEKPTAPTVEAAMELARAAQSAGLKHGVIQDKLFLPGFAKLLFAKNAGFFGRILSIRIDAGSWIFDGKDPGMPATKLELPARRGRRDRTRYDGALALHDRSIGLASDCSMCVDGDGDTRTSRRAGEPLCRRRRGYI